MKAHRTDQVSLVFALIFLAVAGWWLLAQILHLALPAVGWFLAGALILVGALGLFGALRSARSGAPGSGSDDDDLGPAGTGLGPAGGGSEEPTRELWPVPEITPGAEAGRDGPHPDPAAQDR